MRATPHLALSLMRDDDFRRAALPLFERELVDAVEWSFDLGFDAKLPPWLAPLLDAYAAADRLYGHGVGLSPSSAAPSFLADRWLENASREHRRREYRLVSEHVGASRAADLVRGAPLPVPVCAAAVTALRENVQRLQAATRRPVGLENLALAFSRDEALAQGSMIDAALEPLGDDGFVLLDLHNAFCQMHNFGIDAATWLASWPLSRVKAIHVAGGSWATHDGRNVRRDTHDGAVPGDVLTLLATVLTSAPHVEVVTLERLGGTLDAAGALVQDFMAVKELVARVAAAPSAPASAAFTRAASITTGCDDVRVLARYQDALVDVLGAAPEDAAAASLAPSLLADARTDAFHHDIAAFDPAMLEVARVLVARWSQR